MDAAGLYVFGVTSPGGPLPANVDPAPLATTVVGFTAGGVQAIISRIPTAELLGEAPQDPEWLVSRVCAHDRVLTAIAMARPVVPFRFGVLHSNEQALESALVDSADHLDTTLRNIGNSQEWTVVIDCPAPTGGHDSGSEDSRGRSYLLSRQAELTARDRIDGAAYDVSRACDEWGLPTAALPPTSDGGARLACLIPRGTVSDVVARLESVCTPDALRIEMVGPLPPYHFVDWGGR